MKLTTINLLAFCVFAFLWNCTVSDPKAPKTVLKIGNLSVSEYEIQRQYNQAFQGAQDVESKDLERFEEEIQKKYLLLADAYNRHFDTISSIRKRVKYASDFMMSVKGGYLWKQTVLPQLEAMAAMTNEKLQRRSRIYYFDAIQCNRKAALLELFGSDTLFNAKARYEQLKREVPAQAWLREDKIQMQWPFGQYVPIADQLEAMAPGDISNLLTIQDFGFVFRLDSVGKIEVTEADQGNFEDELKYYAEYKVINSLYDSIKMKGNARFNDASIEKLSAYLAAGNTIFNYSGIDTLMSYSIDRARQYLTVPQYLEILTYNLQPQNIQSKQDVENSLLQAYNNQYFANEAHKLNLYENQEFLWDKQNFQNDLLHKYYIENEISNAIHVDSAEVTSYHAAHPNEFAAPSLLKVNIYLLKTVQAAGAAYNKLRQFYAQNPTTAELNLTQIPEIKTILPDITINKGALNDFAPKDRKTVLLVNQSMLSQILTYQGKPALLLVKEAEGNMILPVDLVFEQIYQALLSARTETAVAERVAQLKNIYKFEINTLNADKFRYQETNK